MNENQTPTKPAVTEQIKPVVAPAPQQPAQQRGQSQPKSTPVTNS